MRLARRSALAVVLLLATGASHAVNAQTTGALVGTVADAQGATVPGATVSLISESRGISIDTQSSGTGDFTFPSVLPDTYTVRVSVDGFKTPGVSDASAATGAQDMRSVQLQLRFQF